MELRRVQVRKIMVKEKEISDEKRINGEIELFYKKIVRKVRGIFC